MKSSNEVPVTSKKVGEKKRWEPPKLTRVGRVAEIVQGGGGKLSPQGGDPGEIRKKGPTG